jgi:hypothetical protein
VLGCNKRAIGEMLGRQAIRAALLPASTALRRWSITLLIWQFATSVISGWHHRAFIYYYRVEIVSSTFFDPAGIR